MRTDNFSFKEVYDVFLRTNVGATIGGVHYPAGSIIAVFDRIDSLNFEATTQSAVATGGQTNPFLVVWESMQGASIMFSEGVFSEQHLALLTNSRMVSITDEQILVTLQETLQSDQNGVITLKVSPQEILALVNMESGVNLIEAPSVGERSFEVDGVKKPYYIIYEHLHQGSAKMIEVGNQLITGYLSLEAKTRAKEKGTGKDRIGILKIPKLQLMSGLSIRLGEKAPPISAPFMGIALPIEREGKRVIAELFFLEDEI